jgi:hypothetical protein
MSGFDEIDSGSNRGGIVAKVALRRRCRTASPRIRQPLPNPLGVDFLQQHSALFSLHLS